MTEQNFFYIRFFHKKNSVRSAPEKNSQQKNPQVLGGQEQVMNSVKKNRVLHKKTPSPKEKPCSQGIGVLRNFIKKCSGFHPKRKKDHEIQGELVTLLSRNRSEPLHVFRVFQV